MTINNVDYRLTKHGRQRFRQRVAKLTDVQIIQAAYNGVHGFTVIWNPDKVEGYRLVTIIPVDEI